MCSKSHSNLTPVLFSIPLSTLPTWTFPALVQLSVTIMSWITTLDWKNMKHNLSQGNIIWLILFRTELINQYTSNWRQFEISTKIMIESRPYNESHFWVNDRFSCFSRDCNAHRQIHVHSWQKTTLDVCKNTMSTGLWSVFLAWGGPRNNLFCWIHSDADVHVQSVPTTTGMQCVPIISCIFSRSWNVNMQALLRLCFLKFTRIPVINLSINQ